MCEIYKDAVESKVEIDRNDITTNLWLFNALKKLDLKKNSIQYKEILEKISIIPDKPI